MKTYNFLKTLNFNKYSGVNLLFVLLLIALLSSCDQPTQRLDGYDIHGIDVSHHQKEINWDSVASQGIHFTFIKATEGETHQDTKFAHNWSEANRVGLKRGAYHFFRPGVPGLNQALNFIENVPIGLGDLPPVLDIEVTDNVSDVVVINRIRSWLQIIEKHYQIRPIIYTNQKYYKRFIAGNFDDYPFWLARFGEYAPSLPANQRWSFWQYGERGQVKGIEGPVDLNVFIGTHDAFDSMGNGTGEAISADW